MVSLTYFNAPRFQSQNRSLIWETRVGNIKFRIWLKFSLALQAVGL